MKHALTNQSEMPKAFDPKAIEAGWYARWESAGLFTADPTSDKETFTICLPPPNITGELHLGHALNGTVQDITARYRRMAGFEGLFLPGTDHAAIATRNVIEKRLAKDGVTKEQIGREAVDALVDAGVGVNPSDDGYKTLIGKTAVLPLVGRKLPIVGDDLVEKDFGTGALKVTPGHDPMDYDIGQRHSLELINGMHLDGSMNVPGTPYDGLPALEARTKVVADLKEQGFLLKEEPYTHQVGHCDRCHTVIEPLVSEQWWLRMDVMRDKALAASAEGKVRWHPARYERTYLHWLRGLRDWNIGRQLWLGHRGPVFRCENGHQFASVDRPAACPECADTQIP